MSQALGGADAPPILGVSLDVITKLRDEARALQASAGPPRVWRAWEDPPSRRAAGEPLTTECVCFELVRPRTAAAQCALVALLPPAQVSPATVFVSHAWRYAFDDLVDAIERAPLAEPRSVWLDVIANSQWQTDARDFTWWTTTFRTSIQRIGTTLAVFAPWSDPISLTRAWCLYELFIASVEGELVVAMPAREEADFVSTIRFRFDEIARSLSRLSLARAQAFSAADRAAIFGAVEQTVGVHALDATVLAAVRAWLLDAGLRALAAGGGEASDVMLSSRLAVLLEGAGRRDEAEGMYRRALSAQEAHEGAAHAETLSTALNLAVLLLAAADSGGADARAPRLAEAEALLRRALAGFDELCGAAEGGDDDGVSKHEKDAVIALSNVGRLCASTGRLDEANECYTRGLERARAKLGAESAELYLLMGQCALLRYDRGDVDGAIVQLRDAIAGRTRVLGESHVSTLFALGRLAQMLRAKGELAEAEALTVTLVERRERTLGVDHADTLESVVARAWFLEARGDAERAQRLYEHALRGLAPEPAAAAAGAVDMRATMAAEGAARCAQLRGDARTAEALFARALSEREACGRGMADGGTLAVASSLSTLLRARGALREAEAVYRRMIDGIEATRASGQLAVPELSLLTLRHMLARAVAAQGDARAEDAEALLRDALARRRAVLGAEHPHVHLSANTLGAFLSGRPGGADEGGALCAAFLAATDGVLPDGSEERLAASRAVARAARLRAQDGAAAFALEREIERLTLLLVDLGVEPASGGGGGGGERSASVRADGTAEPAGRAKVAAPARDETDSASAGGGSARRATLAGFLSGLCGPRAKGARPLARASSGAR